MRDMSVDCKMM